MQLKDSRVIAAPRDEVWAALLDPEVLKASVPGCQEMTGNAEDGFEATVVQKVGPVKATFKGRVVLSEMTAPERLTLTGEGKGGAAGFAKGSARVELEDDPEGTRLVYDVEAKVGGKLAQLGSRIIDGFAKKMADQFFERFQARVEGTEEAGDDAGSPADGTEPDSESEENGKKPGWIKRTLGR